MNWQSFLDKLTSGGIPAGAMVGGGIIVLLIALKAAKGVLKIIFILRGVRVVDRSRVVAFPQTLNSTQATTKS